MKKSKDIRWILVIVASVIIFVGSTFLINDLFFKHEEPLVFITRTGERYHHKSCSYLRESSIPIGIEEAEDKGYSACSRCKGKTSGSIIVNNYTLSGCITILIGMGIAFLVLHIYGKYDGKQHIKSEEKINTQSKKDLKNTHVIDPMKTPLKSLATLSTTIESKKMEEKKKDAQIESQKYSSKDILSVKDSNSGKKTQIYYELPFYQTKNGKDDKQGMDEMFLEEQKKPIEFNGLFSYIKDKSGKFPFEKQKLEANLFLIKLCIEMVYAPQLNMIADLMSVIALEKEGYKAVEYQFMPIKWFGEILKIYLVSQKNGTLRFFTLESSSPIALCEYSNGSHFNYGQINSFDEAFDKIIEICESEKV